MNSKNLKDKPDYEIGSGNADLGRPAASNLPIKAQLISKISELLEERGLTQVKAATLPGIAQPKLSSMLRGQFSWTLGTQAHGLPHTFRARRTN